MNMRVARSDAELRICFPVVAQLRSHLGEREFVEQVNRQREAGYQVVYREVDGEPVCVAGFRVLEKLSSGRVLHVDDLVTAALERSHGYGAELLKWLKKQAKKEGCDSLQLDSGVRRTDAHRFYEREGLEFSALHFTWAVNQR